jgi:hypothetical protein
MLTAFSRRDWDRGQVNSNLVLILQGPVAQNLYFADYNNAAASRYLESMF